jgi:exo-beta-1,3-glucanase (GH17 family)
VFVILFFKKSYTNSQKHHWHSLSENITYISHSSKPNFTGTQHSKSHKAKPTMAITHLPLLLLLLLLLINPLTNVSSVGINYGTLGNNLPSPKRVAQLLQSTLIDKVKIYDTNPEILQAFSNTGIDLIVAVENYHVSNISKDASSADEWLTTRVVPFIPATSIVAIVVGNEYLTTDDDKLEPKALVQAMQNLHAALVNRGLDRKIKVTTPHSMAILASSFPPSASTFALNLMPTMTAIVGFLADTGAPFMVNAYPYFAYRNNPGSVNLEYALLGNATGVRDPKGYVYNNMLDAQIDSIRSAINALGFGNMTIEITVSESGWPSKGEHGDSAATPQNAKTYNTRLIERAQAYKGTPMKPKDKIDIYVFALFNENKKEGDASERNFGLFNGDGSKVYDVDLSCQFCSNGGTLGFGEKVSSGARGPSVWCVAKPHSDEKVLQAVLDFCCGPGGVDCREIYESGDCFEPNKLLAHSSYAMNAYYQMHGRNYWNCDFKGTGLVAFSDPSKCLT